MIIARLWRPLFWTAMGFAFVMAVAPQVPMLPGKQSDKIQHIAAFIVLGGLAASAYPRTEFFRLLAGLSLFGALIEVVQAIPLLNRDSDPLDWLADTVAAALALAGARLVQRQRTG